MSCYHKKSFTLIEMLTVIFILGVFAGLLSPSLGKAKERAKYTRWLSTNNNMNSDPATVINYNFENADFKMNYQGAYVPAIYNSATACESTSFAQSDYHGILRNAPEWKRGGRWNSKTSLQFDGRATYVEIPGTSSINFNTSEDDFTISTWVKMDNITGTQTFFSKCEANKSSQYDAFLNGSRKRFETNMGQVKNQGKGKTVKGTAWTSPVPAANQWSNIVITSESGKSQMYVNGKAMTGMTTSGTNSSSNVKMYSDKFILGAANTTSKNKGYYFMGRMDELIVSKRLWKPSEIKAIYEMGAP